ncbi:hypothetical protein [Nocardioides sp. T2.26MG-1]|uniref:hypothetical protein n=1 Tax=Nocardioides sp. T2.26MG-1 TaxID=3041166 RepID=UPI002541D2A8|nr:hypothetical protein [Nocardioides sp. T2.26MG-1]
MRFSRGRLAAARANRSRRLTDSAAVRRRRAIAGLALLVVGLGCLAFGIAAGRADPPAAVQLAPEGVTEVPATHFYENPWVLYGQVDDPRRPPSAADVGCLPETGLQLPEQPEDLTIYGARVVDGVSIAAIALYGRSGDGASVRCTDASDYAPLWLIPSSDARPFTATGIAILGILLLVAAALVHPATSELSAQRWAAGRSRRRSRR